MLAATRDVVIGVCFGVAALAVLLGVGWLCGRDNQDDPRSDGHAANCDGWHHPISGHCGDCGCFTCSAER